MKLKGGTLPPADSVRIEELVNYFDYEYPQPSGAHPFSVTSELAACPWQPEHRLALIGLQGRSLEQESVPPRTYYAKVQAVPRKYDILFIADEVICGFGRTGNMWGSETFGIKPDILTCAKQLSSAYLPISAVLISEKVYRAMERMRIATVCSAWATPTAAIRWPQRWRRRPCASTRSAT